MTSPIDPIRRSEPVRRSRRKGESPEAAGTALPVPVRAAPPPAPIRPAAPIAAQILGEGERRGLRGGAPVLKAAKSTYERTEWSGSADRRAPKGSHTRTKV